MAVAPEIRTIDVIGTRTRKSTFPFKFAALLKMMNIARALGWLLIGIILVLSVVPPTARPVTAVPHGFEHFAIFALCGACFGLGYQASHHLQVIFLIVFSGTIEILQLL